MIDSITSNSRTIDLERIRRASGLLSCPETVWCVQKPDTDQPREDYWPYTEWTFISRSHLHSRNGESAWIQETLPCKLPRNAVIQPACSTMYCIFRNLRLPDILSTWSNLCCVCSDHCVSFNVKTSLFSCHPKGIGEPSLIKVLGPRSFDLSLCAEHLFSSPKWLYRNFACWTLKLLQRYSQANCAQSLCTKLCMIRGISTLHLVTIRTTPLVLLGLLSIQTPSCFSILFNNVFRSWHLKIIDALPLSKGKWRAGPATGIGVQLWGAPSWRGAPTQPVLRSMCHVARLEQCWSLSSPGRALCFLHLQQGKKKPQGGGRGRAMTWWLGRGGTQQPRPKLGKLGPPAGTGWGPDSKLEKIYIWAKMFFL